MLRKQGDFPNRSVVEYATVLIRVRNDLLPQNLRSYHWEHDDNSMITVGVSPAGRLRGKSIYLDSIELAEQFAAFLHQQFEKRKYKSNYTIEVLVDTTSQGKTVIRWKEFDSRDVRDVHFVKCTHITNSSSGIQHAWHFWYAVVFVLKWHAVTSVLRASPLNWALCA